MLKRVNGLVPLHLDYLNQIGGKRRRWRLLTTFKERKISHRTVIPRLLLLSFWLICGGSVGTLPSIHLYYTAHENNPERERERGEKSHRETAEQLVSITHTTAAVNKSVVSYISDSRAIHLSHSHPLVTYLRSYTSPLIQFCFLFFPPHRYYAFICNLLCGALLKNSVPAGRVHSAGVR
jgi:hypothetical protein